MTQQLVSWVTLTLLLAGSAALAADVATAPAGNTLATSRPAQTQPASRPAAVDPAVEKILDRLEQKGSGIHDIEAGIVYIKEDLVLQSKQQYQGVLYFKEEQPNPRFLIRFDRSVHDGVLSNKREWHTFDGQWYIEARESTASINKHQVVRPGEKVNVFRLGEGPFPLPFGQKKADILQNFAVKLVPPAPKDPPNSDHLECTPLPGTKLDKQYDTVHFWISRELDLPIKLTTVKRDEDQQISVEFKDVKLNKSLPGSQLEIPKEATKDFSITENRLSDEE